MSVGLYHSSVCTDLPSCGGPQEALVQLLLSVWPLGGCDPESLHPLPGGQLLQRGVQGEVLEQQAPGGVRPPYGSEPPPACGVYVSVQ